MGIADDKGEAVKPSGLKRGQEVAPVNLGLAEGGADTENGAFPIGADPDGDEDGAVQELAALSDFFVSGVQDHLGTASQRVIDPASKIREGLTKRERTKMETTQSRYARRYDREFKENAVALVESGREVKEVARDLGVSHWSLKNWCKQSQAGKEQTQVGTLDGESSLQREVRRMRQEIDYLRRQRDILKKALGIVSVDVPGSALR
jgi:transposase-like protein